MGAVMVETDSFLELLPLLLSIHDVLLEEFVALTVLCARNCSLSRVYRHFISTKLLFCRSQCSYRHIMANLDQGFTMQFMKRIFATFIALSTGLISWNSSCGKVLWQSPAINFSTDGIITNYNAEA